MPDSKTYKTRVIVLRKTKLGEKDLIVTLLDETGALVKAVAKGARRPGSALAARMELFSTVNCMLSRGKNLDVVVDARLAQRSPASSCDIEFSTCAASLAELLCTVAQVGLEHPRLFDMTSTALSCMATAQPDAALAVTAASLMKVLASAGFRPSLDDCVSCGKPIGPDTGSGWVKVSFADGGVVCDDCARSFDVVGIDSQTIRWVNVFLQSRFSQITQMGANTSTCFDALQFARQWARAHTGRDLKSLDFLLTSGIF